MLIEFTGYSGKPLWIESTRVMSAQPMPPAMCEVTMSCESGSENWHLCSDAETVIAAVNKANAAAGEGEREK